MNSKSSQLVKNLPQGFHGKFSTLINGKRHTWLIQSLIEETKNLAIFEVSIDEFEQYLDVNAWFHGDKETTLREIISHYKRAEQSDLSYPIILSDEFGVMDGLHRILKAHLSGQSSLPVVRLLKTPPPDYIGEF